MTAPDVPPGISHASSSHEQRDAEQKMLLRAGERYGVSLEGVRVPLPGGAFVEIDGASADLSVLVECYARQAVLKPAQVHKVATDLLKLVTVRDLVHPGARLALVVADPEVAARLHGGWLGEAVEHWEVEVLEVARDQATRHTLVAAQTRQAMTNVVPRDTVVEP